MVTEPLIENMQWVSVKLLILYASAQSLISTTTSVVSIIIISIWQRSKLRLRDFKLLQALHLSSGRDGQVCLTLKPNHLIKMDPLEGCDSNLITWLETKGRECLPLILQLMPQAQTDCFLHLWKVEEMAGGEPCKHPPSLPPFINLFPALVWQLSL